LLSGRQFIAKNQHITHLNVIFIVRLAVVPEVILANLIHAKPALLIERDSIDAAVRGAHQHPVLAASARLFEQPGDQLFPKPLPVASWCNCQFDYLAPIVTLLHGGCSNQLPVVVHTIDQITQVDQAPAQRAFCLFGLAQDGDQRLDLLGPASRIVRLIDIFLEDYGCVQS
jgi:hypothetical protein